MTDITYRYEVIAVDEAARCMEVVYTSETYGVERVCARLPFEGEPIEQVIAIFAPVPEWRLRAIPAVAPIVGAAGELLDVNQALISLESQARAQRNTLLAASDWTQVADAPVDQAAWATYRQALRDITAQEVFPETIDWPVAPE